MATIVLIAAAIVARSPVVLVKSVAVPAAAFVCTTAVMALKAASKAAALDMPEFSAAAAKLSKVLDIDALA